jgi:hypothetical protein
LKIALAPHSGRSVARQRGAVPPPHSSVKMTVVPSLLNVAECQYAKFGSTTSSMRTRVGRVADVEQDAVARAGAGGEAELRIDRDVVAVVRLRRALRALGRGRHPARGRRCCRLRIGEDARLADDARLLRRRERHADHLDPEERGVRVLLQARAEQPGSSSPARTPAGARDVDVDDAGIVRIRHQRVRVRAAARLHGRDLRGLSMSLMSKMRTPRKRSGLTGSGTPCTPQSTRPRVSSTDMKSRLPCTETSPCPPGQTTERDGTGGQCCIPCFNLHAGPHWIG